MVTSKCWARLGMVWVEGYSPDHFDFITGWSGIGLRLACCAWS